MATAVQRLYDELDGPDGGITGVVVASAKKTFFAGGNLKSMVQATEDDAARSSRWARPSRPACVASSCSPPGRGRDQRCRARRRLRICLATNHRILVDDDRVEIGLPESTLGLLPGGGGVTRVVRLLGLQPALMDVLLPGTRFKPQVAKEKGLVDELVATREDRARREGVDQGQPGGVEEPVGRRRLPDARRHAEHPEARGVPAERFPALLRKQTKGAVYPAPRAILSAASRGSVGSTPLRGSSRAT